MGGDEKGGKEWVKVDRSSIFLKCGKGRSRKK